MNQPKIHYLDNEKFIELLEKHAEEKKLHPEIGCPNEIGAMFLIIARHFISKWPSEITFQYREDMISKAVEYCLRYMGNYSRKISDNPFSFFTCIITSAFQQEFNYQKKSKELVKRAVEKLANEEYFPKIKNNVKTYSPFNNPIDEQMEFKESHEIKEDVSKIIIWEDELVIENLNTVFLDELINKENEPK
jgi:hypothetical protein